MKHSRQRGFSLLEAVVAMVLISGAGYALFGWINSNIMALNRIHETNARSEATQNILEYMNGINPMLKPEGSASLGQYKIRWESRPITLIQDGNSLYQLALYDTLVKADSGETQPWFEFRLRQVGYKKVRELLPP
jgi:general secretion pathway protein I